MTKKQESLETLDKEFILYTDGSSTFNIANPDGFGGCAFVALNKDEEEIHRHNCGIKGTVSVCELSAALLGLKWAEENGANKVTVYSDSTYFVYSYNKWMHGWHKRGWVKSTGEEVSNLHIMKELYEIKSRLDSSAVHVKGHNGNYWNEIVDELASKARVESVLCG